MTNKPDLLQTCFTLFTGAGLFFLLSLTPACKKKNATDSLNYYLKRSDFKTVENYHLTATPKGINKYLLNPTRVYLHKDYLFFVDRNNRNGSILIFAKDTYRPVRAFGGKGNGPGLFLGLKKITFGQQYIFAYDLTGNKIISYHLDSLIANKNYQFDRQIILNDHRNIDCEALSDTTFLLGIYGGDKRFVVIDQQGNIKSSFLDYPPLENKFGTPAYEFRYNIKANIYQGNAGINRTARKLILTHTNTDLLQLVDYDSGKLLRNIIGPNKNFPPDYELTPDGRSYPPKDKNYGYLGSLYVSNKYIYVLYYGKKYDVFHHDEIFQFDWDGRPVSHIKLDTKIYGFAVDEANNKIYGLRYEDPPFLVFTKE